MEDLIFEVVHREMVVMSGPQSIKSHYKPYDILNEDSFSSNTLIGLGIHDFDTVSSLSMNPF